MLACGWGILMPPAVAAERVTIRLGPLEQKIAIADLESFAATGELPTNLRLYAPVLNAQVREVLNRRLQLDPNLGDKVITDLMQSPTGKQLIESLLLAIPHSTVEQIQAAVTIAARQADGLSLLSLLRAYPEENITLDASSAVAVALQFNPSYWQSQALGPLLERELAVASKNNFKPSFNPMLPGPRTVQQQTLTLQDQQRHRTIPVDIYWSQQLEPSAKLFSQQTVNPCAGNVNRRECDRTVNRLKLTSTQQAAKPIVVISHGLGANRKFFTYLARHLASHGVTVAALDHPDSDNSWLARLSAGNNPGELLPATEFVERPQDISFLLDELAKLNQSPGLLQGKLNTQQVSVIGHSLGGYTALALAGAELQLSELRQLCRRSNAAVGQAPADWLQCSAAKLPEHQRQLRDSRVASAIALNPVVGNLFGNAGLTQVATPVLILGGTEDVITPIVNHQLRPFSRLQRPKYLLTAIGATHLSISEPVNLDDQATAGSIVNERRGQETAPLRQLVQGVSLAFVKQLTPEAKLYQPFLTPDYAQSLSTAALPLRLNTELPASVVPWINTVVQVSQVPQYPVPPKKLEKVAFDPTENIWNPSTSINLALAGGGFNFLWTFLLPLPLLSSKTKFTRK